MTPITSISPAKIHLIGEYSAIYGKPTILFPINLELSLTIQKTTKKTKKEPFQKIIEQKFEKKYGKKIPNYSLQIKSNIPIGSGLGSSAALSAALTKSLAKMLNLKLTDDDIFDFALEGEKYFHGFPSGSDLWTIIAGKILWYRKETPDLIIKKPLDLTLSENLSLFLIDSGTPEESTKEMVTYVIKNVQPKNFQLFADAQEALTKEMYYALKENDQKSFLRIIKDANKNLQALGVVSKTTKEIIKKIEAISGAAKITGAGGRKKGSGMIIATHIKPAKLISLAQKNNWKIIPIELATRGLK